MNPVGRNEPCPCGSGKRYKECHGTIGTPAAPLTAAAVASAAPPWVAQALREALRVQRSGRAVEAAEAYRRILVVDPSNFDATHMLGLVEYENGRHDVAMALLKRAIELRPELGTPRHNLRLLESMPLIELEICREVLPRLDARIDTGFDLTALATASSVHIVLSNPPPDDDGRSALAHVVAACGAAPVTIWHRGAADASVGSARMLKLTADDHPRDGWLVLIGAGRSQAAWLHATHMERTLLIVTRDEPCAIIDRIDELEAAAEAVPGLLCASRALAERLRLPLGATLTPRELAARPLS